MQASALLTSVVAVAYLLMAASCRPMATGPGERSSRLSDLQGVLTAGNRKAALGDRIQTKTVENVTVSACLLPDEEARQRYGVSLAKKGLQAVWLRVTNNTSDENWLLTAHLHPDYFTADEAAYQFRLSPSNDPAPASPSATTCVCGWLPTRSKAVRCGSARSAGTSVSS